MGKRKKSELEFANQELEELDKSVVTDEDNPLLQQAVIERDYSGGDNFKVVGNVVDSVEEPKTQQPVVNFSDDDDDDDFDDFGNKNTNKDDDDDEPYFPPRPDGSGRTVIENNDKYIENFDELSGKTQSELTGNLANTIVDLYKFGINFGKKCALRTKQDYQRKALLGKFDMKVLNYKYDLGDGEAVRYGELVNNYNDTVEEVMTLDENTESDMRTLIKRIGKKKGVGMSDETALALLVGRDLVTKIGTLTALTIKMNRAEKVIMAQIRRQNKPVQQVVYQQPQPQPQQRPVTVQTAAQPTPVTVQTAAQPTPVTVQTAVQQVQPVVPTAQPVTQPVAQQATEQKTVETEAKTDSLISKIKEVGEE